MKRLPFLIGLISLCVPLVASAESFSVSLTSSKMIVEPKQTYIYTVTVTNTGNSTAEDAEVALTLDEDLDFMSASNGGKKSRGSVVWDELTLAPGASRTFNASVKVDSKANDNEILYVTAFSGNAYAESQVRVENEEDENNDDEHAITVELFSNKPQVEPNEPFAFIVKLHNKGERRVSDVDITLRLADNIEFLSASNEGTGSDDEIEWKNIDINGEETRTFTVGVEVTDKAAHGDSLTSILYAEGSVNEHKIKVWDPEWMNEYMKLFAFAEKSSVEQGGTLEYTFRVKNLADHDDVLTIDAYMDPKTTFASASDDGLRFDTNLVKWENEFFEQSETRSFTLKVDVPEDINSYDVIRLGVQAGVDRKEIVTEITDPPPLDFVSRSTDSGQAGSASGDGSYFIGFKDGEFVMGDGDASDSESINPPPIEVTMESNKDEAQPGDLIKYTIILKNSSNQDLKDLKVKNIFSVRQVTVKDSAKGTVEDDTITWNIDSLKSGSKWTKKLYVSALSDLKHGDVITTSTEVWSNSLIGGTEEQTNVITLMPQAGWGTFSIALNKSKKYLSTPAHAASAAPPAKSINSDNSALPILWTILIVTGLAFGGVLGLKKY